MKIQVLSDLHLDVSGPMTLPGGEVLILAGDICEARNIRPDREEFYNFFHIECAKYDRVFYVIGNHEHYHGRFDKTYNYIKSVMPNNVTLLEQEYEEYNGVIFLGATLWTDLNKGDPVTMYSIKSMMNDYKVVQNFYSDRQLYHKLTPDVTYKTHKDTVAYFQKILAEKRDRPIVVITHMAPSFMSVNEKYKNDTTNNGGYASDLSDIILDNSNIKVWVHGHMHDPVDYMIGDTRVLANPRGYIPWEAGNGFDINCTFDV